MQNNIVHSIKIIYNVSKLSIFWFILISVFFLICFCQVDDRHMPEDFLRRDIRVGEERHLIFATGPQLDYLKRAKVWYLDGTFSVVKEPFHQLFSVHSFVRTGETEKQVPLLFVVMSRRQKRDYKAVFKAVLEMLPAPPAVEEAVLDFESAVWSALASVLPDVEVHGCSFHWAQAVYRKVCSKNGRVLEQVLPLLLSVALSVYLFWFVISFFHCYIYYYFFNR